MPEATVAVELERPLCDDVERDEPGQGANSRSSVCVRCGAGSARPQRTADDDLICYRCARDHYLVCDRCDALVADTDSYQTAYGTDVCPRCRDTHYWHCEGCCDLVDSGDYCEDCDEDRLPYSEWIHDYGYKPRPVFFGDGPLYLGAELELEVPRGELDTWSELAANRLGPLGYLKEDSSIGHGFEIVTHPMSYDAAAERFPWGLLAELDAAGCYPGGHGLHVHVSRAAFGGSTAHLYRWIVFVYRNAAHVKRVARRDSEDWASFSDEVRHNAKHYAKGLKGHRYRAINTQNEDTLELRVFASSLDARHVKAALALSAASVEYTRDLTAHAVARGAWDWSAFLDWARACDRYAPVIGELEVAACAS